MVYSAKAKPLTIQVEIMLSTFDIKHYLNLMHSIRKNTKPIYAKVLMETHQKHNIQPTPPFTRKKYQQRTVVSVVISQLLLMETNVSNMHYTQMLAVN